MQACLHGAMIEVIWLRAQVAYNALSAGVKTQLPLPPMSPDSAVPASSEPAAMPANRPFDPTQVTRPPLPRIKSCACRTKAVSRKLPSM